jgi:hypothetical protein
MSIIQKPAFNLTLTSPVKITFLLQDFDMFYTKTVDYIARKMECYFITEASNVIFDGKSYNARTMLIPSSYMKNEGDFINLKNIVKLACKHNEIICFLEFGSVQRVYNYRVNSNN